MILVSSEVDCSLLLIISLRPLSFFWGQVA